MQTAALGAEGASGGLLRIHKPLQRGGLVGRFQCHVVDAASVVKVAPARALGDLRQEIGQRNIDPVPTDQLCAAQSAPPLAFAASEFDVIAGKIARGQSTASVLLP
jgi:hypothetical protein